MERHDREKEQADNSAMIRYSQFQFYLENIIPHH